MSDVVYYIISAVLTVGVLVGIAMMSKVRPGRQYPQRRVHGRGDSGDAVSL